MSQLALDFAAIAATVDRPRRPRRAQDVHEHSRAAHDAELLKLSLRAANVLTWLREHGPATDRQVATALGFTDMNGVRPRITELIDANLLEESGKTLCPTTGKRVRIVSIRAASASPQQPQGDGYGCEEKQGQGQG